MKTVIKDEFLDGILAQGEAVGLVKGKASMLLRYLDTRFDVPDAIRERVTGCADAAQLEAWLDRAVAATTLDEIFAQ